MSQQRERAPAINRPKSHQISLVSITLNGNATAAFYCIHDRDEVEKHYITAIAEGKPFRVETGDVTEETRESIVLIPTAQIMLLAVAKINHIALSHGILT